MFGMFVGSDEKTSDNEGTVIDRQATKSPVETPPKAPPVNKLWAESAVGPAPKVTNWRQVRSTRTRSGDDAKVLIPSAQDKVNQATVNDDEHERFRNQFRAHVRFCFNYLKLNLVVI